MTYKELLQQLSNLTEEQLDQDATIMSLGQREVFPIFDLVASWEVENENDRTAFGLDIAEDILDEDSVYLTID